MHVRGELKNGGKVFEIALSGEFDYGDSSVFRLSYQLGDIPTETYILNCAELEYISSAGLAEFLLLNDLCRQKHCQLCLTHLTSPRVIHSIKMADFYQLLQSEYE